MLIWYLDSYVISFCWAIAWDNWVRMSMIACCFVRSIGTYFYFRVNISILLLILKFSILNHFVWKTNLLWVFVCWLRLQLTLLINLWSNWCLFLFLSDFGIHCINVWVQIVFPRVKLTSGTIPERFYTTWWSQIGCK